MLTMEEMILEKIESAKEVLSISFVALVESGQIGAETALSHIDMFEEWKDGITYKIGQIRKHGDVLYKIVQDHISQADCSPLNAPTLYEPIILPDLLDEYPAGQGTHTN